MAVRKRHSDVDPRLLEALDGPFSTGYDYFGELAEWGYTEADIEAMWQVHGRSWLRAGRWNPEGYEMEQAACLTRYGVPP